MDKRYEDAWKEVSGKAEEIVKQLADLEDRISELRNDKVLEGELMYSTDEAHEELEKYSDSLALLQEGVSEAITWIEGNIAIARGEDL